MFVVTFREVFHACRSLVFTWDLDVSCSYVGMVASTISKVFSKLLSVVKVAPQARPKTT